MNDKPKENRKPCPVRALVEPLSGVKPLSMKEFYPTAFSLS